MLYKLTLMIYMVVSFLKKHSRKNDLRFLFPSQFQNFSVKFSQYSQKAGLPNIFQKNFFDYIRKLREKKCPESTFFVISDQGGYLKLF